MMGWNMRIAGVGENDNRGTPEVAGVTPEKREGLQLSVGPSVWRAEKLRAKGPSAKYGTYSRLHRTAPHSPLIYYLYILDAAPPFSFPFLRNTPLIVV